MENVKIVSYGIGVIGRRLARHLLTKAGVETVGAVDINPAIVGKDLGEVLGGDRIGSLRARRRESRRAVAFSPPLCQRSRRDSNLPNLSTRNNTDPLPAFLRVLCGRHCWPLLVNHGGHGQHGEVPGQRCA